MRLQSQPDGSQLVLELSESVQHDSFLLANPPRLVVDLADTQLQRPAQTEALSSTQVRSVRSGVQDGRNLRIVLDLAEVYSHKAYLLPPDGQGGHRLVVEIGGSGAPVKAVLPTQPPAAGAVSQAVLRRKSPLVIVIDPGHGGKDPGAIGPSGVREKDVVLGIARRLRDLINREPGMRAVMTRDRDTFLPLRERISVARRHKADMFISIHADAVESGDAAGASVYMLSTKGASSEAARLLAERENAVDLVGGVKITHHDRDVASVLLDLSQDATLEASMLLARLVLR
ncbi:MAG TPA: N-acetylmuramoyl-L-alanine amidase, partial [Candidatus Competibacteraceae bacterium]|nr:N-acetylmuramoyl-L-alanine amidase [Candidatus Competibacteraceae bacterium]